VLDKGHRKVKALMDNIEKKNEVERCLYQVKQRELDIQDKIIEGKAVTRLRVTKTRQAALAKKEMHMAENEEKNYKKQIEKLQQTTANRIKIFAKKENVMKKEIDFLILENEQLKGQGASLQETVNQRQEIFNMMFSKQIGEEAQQDDVKKKKRGDYKKDEQMYKRAREIAYNRRLYDMAKRQAEEIELLMEELKKLKASTFPNLPNQPMQGYS